MVYKVKLKTHVKKLYFKAIDIEHFKEVTQFSYTILLDLIFFKNSCY